MIGDIVFFKRKDDIISKTISKLINSEYTHVGIIVGDLGGNKYRIIEANRFIRVRTNIIELSDEHKVYTTGINNNDIIDNVLMYSYDFLYKRYDYLQIIGIFLSLIMKKFKRLEFLKRENRIICSSLIDLVYYNSGITRNSSLSLGYIMPTELFSHYNLYEKKLI